MTREIGERRAVATRWGVLALTVFALAGAVVGLGLGKVPLSPSQVWAGLITSADTIEHVLVWDVRMPRAILALICGACLGVAGALCQALLRNPLATPTLLGLSRGAALAMVLARVWSIQLVGVVRALVALVGVTLTGATVLLLAMVGARRPASGARLAVAGLTVGLLADAMLAGVSTAYGSLANEPGLMMGSLDVKTWQDVWLMAPAAGALVVAVALARPFTLALLHPDAATALGLSRQRLMALGGALIVMLMASVVAVAGPLAFVDLLVPIVVRAWVGPDLRRVLPLSAAFGAALLVWADVAARTLSGGGGWPPVGNGMTGVFTAAAGIPCVLLVAMRRRVS